MIIGPGKVAVQLDGIPYRALLQVPMLYGGDLIGVLDVYEYGNASGSERKFNEADVKFLTLFASHAAGAVQSARLFEETRKEGWSVCKPI